MDPSNRPLDRNQNFANVERSNPVRPRGTLGGIPPLVVFLFAMTASLVPTVRAQECTGTPSPGGIPRLIGICPGGQATMGSLGYSTEPGVVLQWEESDDDGVADPWAPVVGGSGGNTPYYTTPPLFATRWYRLRATCTFSDFSDVTHSFPVEVRVCAGIEEPQAAAHVRWLGQDADGSHVLETVGAVVSGWEVIDAMGRSTAITGRTVGPDGRLRVDLAGRGPGIHVVRVFSDRGTLVVRLLHAGH